MSVDTADPRWRRNPPAPDPTATVPKEPSPEIKCGACLRVWPEMVFVKLETGDMARACKLPGPCLQHARVMKIGRWDPAVGIVPAPWQP